MQPALIVIFGITGDLARRKLLPALYNLFQAGLLHPDSQIIGVTRQDLTRNDIIETIEEYARTDERPSKAALNHFKNNLIIHKMNLSEAKDYELLKSKLDDLGQKSAHQMDRLYYLSVPPAVLSEIVEFMGQSGLNHPAGRFRTAPRLLVEKPFGYDLESAKELIAATKKHFKEAQVYRIDHYLAKETTQNILAFRFGNPIFENIWNRDHIARVVITAHEKIGIEGRGGFYEATGALRDLIQSHLLQLMALVAMDQPVSVASRDVHAARYRLLSQIMAPRPNQVSQLAFRGQYEGYRQEVYNPDSSTETYAALRLQINSERWRNVPFVLRTGKQTGQKLTEIEVHFADQKDGKSTNRLCFRLQPDEGVQLNLFVKRPGHGKEMTETAMDFSYRRSFDSEVQPEAYERVLLDALKADQTLFASSREVLAAWRTISPVLSEWQKNDKNLVIYARGQIPFEVPN